MAAIRQWEPIIDVELNQLIDDMLCLPDDFFKHISRYYLCDLSRCNPESTPEQDVGVVDVQAGVWHAYRFS